MKAPIDTYALRARYFPVALVVLPLAVGAVPWIPADSVQWQAVISLVASAPVIVLLAQFGRDLGKKQQEKLFKKWDGPPAVRMLRHRDTHIAEPTKERYRATLSRLLPAITMPSSRSERAKPEEADAVYQSCTDFLRERTRDKGRFRLLSEENVSYGFRRNLWAMKAAGIVFSLGGMVAGVWSLARTAGPGQELNPAAIAGTVVSVVMLTWWLLRIRESWVETAANAYAERLLSACDELQQDAAEK